MVGDEIAVVSKVEKAFQTFTTADVVKAGLNLALPLGGGKFMVVNLNEVTHDDFSSEEVSEQILGNPKLL